MHLFVLLACFLGSALAAEPLVLPVRVHLLASELSEIDSSATPASEIHERFEAINRAFAPAGIVWTVESIVVDRPAASSAYRRAADDDKERRQALRELRAAPTRLATEGFDLYVVQTLGPLGIGGAYQCVPDEPEGFGAAFVGARSKNGRALPTRKWAHEFGHALGLGHTPCDLESSDRLMMSGKCRVAKAGRVAFTAEEVERMRAQAAKGHAVPCKSKR